MAEQSDDEWMKEYADRYHIRDADAFIGDRLRSIAARLAESVSVECLLTEIAETGPKMLETIRVNGFVFRTDLTKADLNEAERWEKLAFTLYSQMADLSSQARKLRGE